MPTLSWLGQRFSPFGERQKGKGTCPWPGVAQRQKTMGTNASITNILLIVESDLRSLQYKLCRSSFYYFDEKNA